MTTPLTVLIAAAGQPEMLGRTLASLARCERPAQYTETLVVENGPQCGIEAVVHGRPREERVRYLYVPEPNKSHALNVTLAGLDGLIFFSDDDVRYDSQILLAYARASWGVGTGEFYGGPLRADYEGQPPPDWLRAYLPATVKGWELNVRTKTRIAKTFLGPNWAAFAEDIRDIGGFDPGLGPGACTGSTGQETEAQQRLLARGAKSYYLPDALAWHFVPRKHTTPEWAIERGFRRGLEWGIRHGRDPNFRGLKERLTWFRLVHRRWLFAAMRLVGGERWRVAADFKRSRWQGRWDGIAIGRKWDENGRNFLLAGAVPRGRQRPDSSR